MAIKNVVFRLDFDASGAKDGAKDYDKAAGQVEKSTNTVATTLKKIGGLVAAAYAVGKIKDFAAESLKLAEVQRQAEAKVAQAIKSTNNAAGRSLEQLKSQATALQQETLFGDEEILNGATAQLLTFTNIAGEEFDRTQAVALDLATVLDGDLQSASIQLGKALNDPVANLSALSRSGIQFSKDQKEVIKSLAETGRLAEAQGVILDELERQYGGQAKAAADASDGTQQLANAFGDLQEAFGNILAAGILPIARGLQDMVMGFTDLITPTNTAVDSLQNTQVELTKMVAVAQTAKEGTDERRKAIEELNKVYPGFLDNIDSENASNAELAERLGEVNDEIVKRIVLERNRLKLQEDAETAADALQLQVQRENELRELSLRAAKDYNFQLVEQEDAQLMAAEAMEKLANSGGRMGGLYGSLEMTLRQYKTANEEVAESQSALNDANAEYERLQERLFPANEKTIASYEEITGAVDDSKESTENLTKSVGKKGDSKPGTLAGSLAALREQLAKLKKELEENVIATDRVNYLKKAQEIDELDKKIRMLEQTVGDVSIEKIGEDLGEFDPSKTIRRAFDPENFSEGLIGAADQTSEEYFSELEKQMQDRADKLDVASLLLGGAGDLVSGFNNLFSTITDNRLRELDRQEEAELERAGDNAAQREKIEKQFDAKRQELEKAAFERNKRMQIALAIIGGAQAVVSTLAAVPGPSDVISLGALRAIQIGFVTATTALQIGTIAAQQFAEGEIGIHGPGSETSDDIPAWLSRGESVITAKRTRQYRPVLEAIHSGIISPDLLNSYVLNMTRGESFSDAGIIGATDKQTRRLIGKLDEVNSTLRARSNYRKYFA